MYLNWKDVYKNATLLEQVKPLGSQYAGTAVYCFTTPAQSKQRPSKNVELFTAHCEEGKQECRTLHSSLWGWGG